MNEIMERPRILVVDDEPIVVEVVERYLQREGYDVRTIGDGAKALAAYEDMRPHLVVLDLMLPHLDGIEICRRIRVKAGTPVIMLTARGGHADLIAGFETGADDYLAKPFSPRELMVRIKAVLRRSFEQSAITGPEQLVSARIALDRRSRRVAVGDIPVGLTGREFDLLEFLLLHPDEVFTRVELLQRVWGYNWGADPSTVTVHVRRLRTKVELNPEAPRHLKTVWGTGYRWDS